MTNIYNKDYFPGKGYKGFCAWCNQVLYGKADKKYHPECKIAQANEKAAIKRLKIKNLMASIQKLDAMLETHYLTSYHNNGIDRTELKEKGFDFGVFTQKITLDNGWRYFKINQFAYTLDRYPQKVSISLCSDLPKLETNHSKH